MPVVDRPILMEAPQQARQELLDELRPHLEKTQLTVFGHDVLIAVYNRAGKKTAGGVFLPETNREDEFQGIVGLVVAFGPMASDENPDFVRWFGGTPPKVGDWVGFNTRDTVCFKLGQVTMREVEWKYLRFRTLVPDEVM